MTRQIIDYDDEHYHGLLVNTFWGGKDRGECVQITEGGPGNNDYNLQGYVQMTRQQAIDFLAVVLRKLLQQTESDQTDPPWWQELAKPKPQKQEQAGSESI